MTSLSPARRRLTSLAREPLPHVRRALARRQRAELTKQVDQLGTLVSQVLAGPLGSLAAGRTLAAAWKAFQRDLASHVLAEAELLHGRGVWSARGKAPPARRRRELERRVREHQHAEEHLETLSVAVASARAGAGGVARLGLRRLQAAMARVETALHEQICLENRVLFRRLRSLQ